MAHLTARDGYRRLVDRLNRFPQGAPPSELLYGILEILFSPREAELVAQLPIKPFRTATAAKAWGLPLAEASGVLEQLASRAILLDLEDDGEPLYVLPPPMAGFFEFSMMRVRGDVDQKRLAELFLEYMNVEEDFIRELFARGETQLGRAFVWEKSVPAELSLQVLDHERASHVVRSASTVAVSLCYCRHKMEHVGRACDAPRDICLTFGNTARSLARHGYARAVCASEGLELLRQAQERGLVQFGENVRETPAFICNCCGCCCEALLAAKRFGFLRPVHTTNFVVALEGAACDGCGKCAKACPVDALRLVPGRDPAHPGRKRAAADEGLCLGCGVCVGACSKGGVRLAARKERVITPVNSTHRVVVMAIERGLLHELVFDNQAHLSHRAMAAILGVILRLPPAKQALASRQLRSRYLDRLLSSSTASRSSSAETGSP
ncbi:MAG TPA: 4Fe-4S dicluster domain-containing protein [Vicinamibacteria bacterium]|nr:4Fe-4S dicluster domain-containing protein [Vicinamibacteria bacterium]